MPGRGSVSGHATVTDVVDKADKDDPDFARIRKRSLMMGASERQSVSGMTLEQIADSMNSSSSKGLTKQQAAEKLQEFGPNLLQKTEAKPFWRILLEQINVLNLLVFVAGLICIMQGRFKISGEIIGDEPDYPTAIILWIIVAGCMIIGAYMEYTCYLVMADVSSMSAPQCKVIRDGEQFSLDSADVVPGDVIALSMGDVVPADARVLTIVDMLTNEMPLTGEPHDIIKTVVPEDPTSPFPSNIVYASTNVVNGSGTAMVTKTGMRTEMGKIAAHLKTAELGLTAVQKTMNKIGNYVTVAMVFLVLAIFLVSYYGKVDDPADPCPNKEATGCYFTKSLLRSIFCAVGAIPETLQPAAMFLLVMGCKQMQTVNAATRKLAAVDTLGACSFICSDKTGTLTEGKMTCTCLLPRVRSADPGEFSFYPTRGFDPTGGIYLSAALNQAAKEKIDKSQRGDGVPSDYGDSKNMSLEAGLVRSTMLSLYMNSYGTRLLEETPGQFTIEGNMSEGALVVAAAKAGYRDDASRQLYTRCPEMEVPFSSSRKMMATVHKLPPDGSFECLKFGSEHTHLAVIKGAPDVLVKSLKRVLVKSTDGYTVDSKPMDEADKQWFEDCNKRLSSNALRVLCIAVSPLTPANVKKVASSKSDVKIDTILEDSSTLVALLGLMDPPRESAKSAIRQCMSAGIRVAMITGDQKPTAVAIAKDLGILHSGLSGEKERAMESAVLKGLVSDESAIDELCGRVTVWARAQPSDKVTIIQSLQRQGHVVAMTGDGVNDAGALKKADIGVAMGIAGTDVAKGASDLVLLDDRFATIIDAVAEGRRIFGNIQKMVIYLLCVNIYEVLIVAIAMVLGWAVPLEDKQLFLANLITHEFYPWCMVVEQAGFFNMVHPPRDRKKPLIHRLSRNVLMPFILFSYGGLMLISQVIGSYLYCGTLLVDTMIGTTSIAKFYDEQIGYSCIYAHSWTKGEDDAQMMWKKDSNPLHCHLYGYEEWGVGNKTSESEAVANGELDLYTGRWGEKFALDQSFLKHSSSVGGGDRGEASVRFDSATWQDQFGWLQRCDANVPLEKQGIAGDNLCWTVCNTKPCWQINSNMNSQEEDSEDDDDDDEPTDPPAKPTLYKNFNVKSWGCRKMRSMILMTMVLMEFAMLYGFSKHEFSPPLVCSNKSFLYMWLPMLVLLHMLLYFPVSIWDNQFAPLDAFGYLLCLAMAAIFFVSFEYMKHLHRRWFNVDFANKKAVAEMLSEGKLRAYAGQREAFEKYPARRPLIEVEMSDRRKHVSVASGNTE